MSMQSRRHWFSAVDFRRRWMIFYLIFNGTLYVMQLVLYTALFLLDDDGIFKDDKQERLNLVRCCYGCAVWHSVRWKRKLTRMLLPRADESRFQR